MSGSTIRSQPITRTANHLRRKVMAANKKLNSAGIMIKRYPNIMISNSIKLVMKDLYGYISKLPSRNAHN